MAGMGGMGKPPPAPPPLVQLPLRKARKLMKDLRAVLSSDKAKKQLEFTRSNAQAKKQKNQEATRQAAVAQHIEELGKDVALKYGLTGVHQAIDSVREAESRKGDKRLRRMLINFREILDGKQDPSTACYHPELDKLADKFIEMNNEERTAAIAKTEKITEELTVDGKITTLGTDEYLRVMKNIVSKGDGYPLDKVWRTWKAQDNVEDKSQIPDKEVAKLNVLYEFLRPQDLEQFHKMMDGVDDQEKKEKKETEEKTESKQEL